MMQVVGSHVWLNAYDLENGFLCPVCNRLFVPNGTGPQSSPVVSELLKMLPSEDIVGGLPPRFHDSAYFLCPAGFIVHFADVTAWDKASADEGYRALMVSGHKDSQGPAKALIELIAERNYLFVHAFGQSSYKHEHD